MQADTFPNLVLDLSEGSHGGAGHAAEEHGCDGDPKHHGNLCTAGSLAKFAVQDHIGNLLQGSGSSEYAHDSIYGKYKGDGCDHPIDTIGEESGRRAVLDG